jgi:hypothetical protein
MNQDFAADLGEDHARAPSPARAPASHRGAQFPGEVIRQRRTFRIGLQFAPLAACIAMPAVLGSILNPDFLHVRSLQLLALGAGIIAGAGIYLLCLGLTRKSHRLHSTKFWLSIAANVVVIVAIAGAGLRAYQLGHAPVEVPRTASDE